MGLTVTIFVLAFLVVATLVGWHLDRRQLRNKLSETTVSRDRWEAKAQNANQKLEAVSNTSGAAVIMHDRSANIVHANVAATKMFRGDALKGKSLIQATLSSEIAEFGIHVAHTQKTDARDIAMPGSNGQILRVTAFPFPKGLSGEPEVMLVVVDVTELRRLETIRRDFVANVSHELRTPLASVRAMAETLQEGALHDDEVADRFLSTIVSEADRLTRISEDLLILSNAESHEPKTEWFDLSEQIAEVTARLEPKASESGLSISLSIPEHIEIEASPDQLEQVLVNLIDNAIKYTPAGGRVSVEAKVHGGQVTVDVRDTGIGIMAEDVPRVFERFYRVDKARSRASGGTGLGLSIVKNIVESHGGEVRVKSEFNHGSTFSFVLPLEQHKETHAVNSHSI